ncbi:thioredoxin [Flavilitoribacter nigricans]|uniref:Thioredoxin n=1 Tax=Flavilitoribacter nigricans (strain ATCC 23147 / DSM 23189 / NBRC 102662 / NCIMB 1420 / SS-2) TaxID=1122177 RepID=A0A2D0N4R3_FLAN2|nr:thioredoxin [Flavilitoribacter nigricans]PHN03139.1 thioredoxin [Flavilitoribacter nigricans DSM 23189 = NBRC 102662]
MRTIKNAADFQAITESGKPVLLDFYADWCGPCQVLLPTVEKLAEKHADDFIIAKVNVDKYPELAQQFGVRSIPALFFLQNGEVQESLVGVQTETALENKIREYSVTA